MASRADKYELYLRSVQDPEYEVRFLTRVFRKLYGESPLVLREDFCGTAAVCCKWADEGSRHQAIGVDLDPQPLEWGREHNLAKLSPSVRDRVDLIEGDVREVIKRKADIIAAQNFSFYCFKTRPELVEYFRVARENLDKQGILVLDMMGGSETQDEDSEEITDHGDFDYVWELHRYDPISSNCLYTIHFAFKDGSRLKGFEYDWRHWTIPEVRELLDEAGFSESQVYWEGTDRQSGEGNGIYVKRDHAEADPSWIAYIVGVK